MALDVTGSMGMIANAMIGESLGTLMGGILDTKPIADPHMMIMAIGDARSDDSPLQMSQFEADIRIAQQLKEVYLEGGGGGNDTESYDLAWHAAATLTDIDSWNKRGLKGYLFTIGDEMPPVGITRAQHSEIYGTPSEVDYTAAELLEMAKERYEVFHVIIEQGNFARRMLPRVQGAWRELMGNRAIMCNDYTRLSEVILSVIRVNEGESPDAVIASYPECATTIAHALYGPTGE